MSASYLMAKLQSTYELAEKLLYVVSRQHPSTTDEQFNGDADIVRDLIRDGAELNCLHGSCLPLQCACTVGDVRMVRLLLENGAQVDASDGFDRTSLHYAAERCWRCVHALLCAGAHVNIADRQGNTALHWAAYTGRRRTVRLLLQHGATPDGHNLQRETALGYAALKGHTDIMALLILEYNCRADQMNLNSIRPLDRIVSNIRIGLGSTGDHDALQLLLRAVNQPQFQNQNGNLQESDYDLVQLHELCRTPRSLQHQCRYQIRRRLGPGLVRAKIESLPIPAKLIRYLQMSEIS